RPFLLRPGPGHGARGRVRGEGPRRWRPSRWVPQSAPAPPGRPQDPPPGPEPATAVRSGVPWGHQLRPAARQGSLRHCRCGRRRRPATAARSGSSRRRQRGRAARWGGLGPRARGEARPAAPQLAEGGAVPCRQPDRARSQARLMHQDTTPPCRGLALGLDAVPADRRVAECIRRRAILKSLLLQLDLALCESAQALQMRPSKRDKLTARNYHACFRELHRALDQCQRMQQAAITLEAYDSSRLITRTRKRR
ncbi:unnamed protein product, partial [Prorocentrum cordatum]